MKNKRLYTSLLSSLLCASLLTGCGSAAKESADFAAVTEECYAEPYYEYENDSYSAAVPTEMNGIAATTGSTAAQSKSEGTLQTEKIIYSASAEIETTEFDASLEAVAAMVERYGGFVESSSINGADYYRSSRGMVTLRSASYTLRIPCEHFEELTGSLNELGNVPYCNTSSENVTASYYDVEARKTAYETQEKRLLEMLEIAESVEDLLAIQSQLSEVQYQIDSLQSRLTNYDRQVNYSTVYLTVCEVEKYTETPAVQLSYSEKLVQTFSDSCETVIEYLTEGSLWFMGNFPEILLWCIVLFLAVKLLKLLFRRKSSAPRKSRKERRAERKAAKAEAKAKKNKEEVASVPVPVPAPAPESENSAEEKKDE